jgi:hypothetical protein
VPTLAGLEGRAGAGDGVFNHCASQRVSIPLHNMTPQAFIEKWRDVELKERSAAQSHFNDLCRLLDVLEPTTADPKGTWFTFEKGASKTSGGEGWADVWRENWKTTASKMTSSPS